MENVIGVVDKEDNNQIDLPPGFRFHPTDEELISHYLSKKVLDSNFSCKAIGEVDLNKSEPWDLPWKAKMGEKEWYFFSMKDRKYPTGLRTNRATESGYWKATGKDKEIYRGKSLVGMKKTLVFYGGRAPKGEKTNWVMHEFRLEGKLHSPINIIPNTATATATAKNEWVISRVFHKSCGKKVHISGLVKLGSSGLGLGLPPPLNRAFPESSSSPYVPCFSNAILDSISSSQRTLSMRFHDFSFYNPPYFPAIFPRNTQTQPNSSYNLQNQINNPFPNSNLQFPLMDQSNSILRGVVDNRGLNINQTLKPDGERITVSQETGLTITTDINNEISSVVSNLDMGQRSFNHHQAPSSSTPPPLNPHNIWNY